MRVIMAAGHELTLIAPEPYGSVSTPAYQSVAYKRDTPYLTFMRAVIAA